MRKWIFAVIAAALTSVVAQPAAAQTIPADTPIYVTLEQSVNSKDAQTGQKLDGTIASDVIVDGNTVIPKGAHARVSVASVQASGRLSTPAKLYLKLDTITVHDRTYVVSAHWWGKTGPSHAKRDEVGAGGGAVAGALIGAIAGGGKGAAIGAAAGAGAGTAGAAATGKKDIEFPAETKARFATKAELKIK